MEPKSFAVSLLIEIDGGFADAHDVDILSENQRVGLATEASTDS